MSRAAASFPRSSLRSSLRKLAAIYYRLKNCCNLLLQFATANEYLDLDNTIQIRKYSNDHIMKAYLLEKSRWTGKCPADKEFDFVRWLNGEDIFNANQKLHN